MLDNLAEDLGQNNIFNATKKVSIDDKTAEKIYYSLNKHLFHNKLYIIPIKYMTFNEIIAEIKRRKGNFPPDENLLGIHYTQFENEIKDIQKDTKLIFDNEFIMMNKDKLDNRSFIFNVASICHEMIHEYDERYGEYPDMVKAGYIFHIEFNSHTTPTFIKMTNLANQDNLKVLQKMYTKDVDILDYDAAMEMMSSIYEDEDKLKQIDRSLKPKLDENGKAIPGLVYISPLNSGGASVFTFD